MKKIFTFILAMGLLLTGTATAQNAEGQRVIYEMNVGMFTTEGTLAAAQDRLTYLHDLGVDIVWLMPIYPRGNSGSPYAAKNFKQVNPSYGTVADLKSFVGKAHQLGMQVWLDWVPNHMANEADWATTNPDYFNRSNGNFIHPNNYADVIELNYNNATLVNELNNCLKFWIDQADIDGYRCDYISSYTIPASYWQTTIPMIKSYKAGKTITFLGEGDLSDNNLARLRNVGFDYDYAWGFQETNLRHGFGASGTAAGTIKTYVNNLISASDAFDSGRMVYLTNHDQNFNDGGATLQGMYGANRHPLTVLQFTAYGMPLLWNGQEVGGSQILNYFSDTKINWSSVDTKMLNTVKSLTSLKHEVQAFRDGKTASENASLTWLTVTNNQGVLAFKRTYNGSEAIVLINFGTSAATATVLGATAGDYALWLDSKTVASGVSRTTVSLNATNTFSLEAKGYAVYVKGTYSEIGGGGDDTPSIDADALTAGADELSVFYECPEKATICAWMWNGSNDGADYADCGAWPGDELTLLGKAANGNYVYKLTVTKSTVLPTDIIFTKNGSADANKTFTGAFTNHGYYVENAGTAAYSRTVPAGSSQGGGTQLSVTEDEISFFFETPTETTYYVWAWDDANDGNAFMVNPNWPGDSMAKVGTADNGNAIYKYVFTKMATAPAYLIVSKNTGDDKIYDGTAFANHGYYVEGNANAVRVVTTGIRPLRADDACAGAVYDLQGRCVAPAGETALAFLPAGIYIQNNRKIAVR